MSVAELGKQVAQECAAREQRERERDARMDRARRERVTESADEFNRRKAMARQAGQIAGRDWASRTSDLGFLRQIVPLMDTSEMSRVREIVMEKTGAAYPNDMTHDLVRVEYRNGLAIGVREWWIDNRQEIER